LAAGFWESFGNFLAKKMGHKGEQKKKRLQDEVRAIMPLAGQRTNPEPKSKIVAVCVY
jgi:hypothetical protein